MLSKKAQYAVYALVNLAKKYNQGPVLIKDISKEELIPQKFLENILLELKNAGYVSSKKGKGGGYYLIKEPQDVKLSEIIRKFDGAIALLPCVTYYYYEKCEHCKDETKCGFRNVIKELRDNTVAFLKSVSLQTLLDRENQA